MTAMTAGIIHNTGLAAFTVAGERVPSGGRLPVDDVTAIGDLPRGALFRPLNATSDPVAELAALKAGAADPAGYTVAQVSQAIAELDNGIAVAALAGLEARGKARTTIAAAAETRLAELATTTDPDPAQLEEPAP